MTVTTDGGPEQASFAPRAGVTRRRVLTAELGLRVSPPAPPRCMRAPSSPGPCRHPLRADAACVARGAEAHHHGDRRPARRRARHAAPARARRDRHRERVALRFIVLLGDFVAWYKFPYARVPDPLWAAELKRLEAPLGIWAILGNHDWWHDLDGVRRALAGVGHSAVGKRRDAARRGGAEILARGHGRPSFLSARPWPASSASTIYRGPCERLKPTDPLHVSCRLQSGRCSRRAGGGGRWSARRSHPWRAGARGTCLAVARAVEIRCALRLWSCGRERPSPRSCRAALAPASSRRASVYRRKSSTSRWARRRVPHGHQSYFAKQKGPELFQFRSLIVDL